MPFDDRTPFFESESMAPIVMSVSSLNRRVASLLQSGIGSVWVRGEIRGFMQATSGHWYFSLKDEGAEVRCAMFAGANRRLSFYPKTGDKVQVHGRVSLYQPRGDYQLVVDGMRQAGLGNLYEQFLRLKDKLQREGLFDADRKRPIPSIARKIGVVTSLQAAALRDVIITLSRRAPYAQIVIYPSSVQGADAPSELVKALQTADARQEVEVILLVRGGGSLQDLWAFNDERVARTVASMSIPVIVGVGHESDMTIADWVGDSRAATPTAAAEMATMPVERMALQHRNLTAMLNDAFARLWQEKVQRLDWAQSQLRTPRELLHREQSRLLHFSRAFDDTMTVLLQRKSQRFHLLSQTLQHCRPSCSTAVLRGLTESIGRYYSQRLQIEKARLVQLQVVLQETDPKALLKRGYSMITDETGNVVQETSLLKTGQLLTIVMSDGEVETEVKRILSAQH